MADINEEAKRIAKLDPQARVRIEAMVKEAVDRELAGGAAGRLGGPLGPAASFSRGILFSKSGSATRLDEEILPELGSMDDAKFKTFMDRVATLKGIQRGG
jgi:hypothetical protein